jgi:hypothetical protein
MAAKMRLGEFLVDKNIITQEALNRALKYQEQWGGRLGDALINLNVISEDKLLAALKYHLNIPVINLEQATIPPDIIKLVPKEMAKKFRAVPVKVGEVSGKNVLFVAMTNPMDLKAIEEIQFSSGMRVQPVLSREKGIVMALSHYYNISAGFVAPTGPKISAAPSEDSMTIIRAGQEVRIDNHIQPVAELPGEPAVKEEEPPPASASEADQREKKVLQALIKLMIEKGYITLEELKKKMSEV